MENFAILIAGPTASGKSALAIQLAEAIGGSVINADSMQVYGELRVLTARPSADDEARVPHLLYGHVPGREAYSAGRFVAEAGRAIGETIAGGRVPIVVGGTGLYFKSLTEGLAPIPEIPAEVRAHWRAVAAEVAAGDLHRMLAERDVEMARRLLPTDRQRVTRALEVLAATGRSLADWQKLSGTPVLAESNTVRLVVEVPRAVLHGRCDARLEAMVRTGAVEEVAELDRLGLDPELPVMRALGVRPLLAQVRGQMSGEAALTAAQAETRQYVKRQQTWLSRHMIAWHCVNAQYSCSDGAHVVTFVQKAIDRAGGRN